MLAVIPASVAHQSNDTYHHQFLTVVFPRLTTHAEVCLRHVRCPHQRAELRAELVALGWLWFLRLLKQGKKPEEFPTAIADFAGRAVQAGRRLCGHEKAKDVLSPLAQRRHGFTVSPLPGYSSLDGNIFDEALRDNTQTPPDEQAAFRVDFPAWVGTYGERDRRLIGTMMIGERTSLLSGTFGMSAARISQMRRAFFGDWSAFCGEPVQVVESTPNRA
jgi:hypothetical protein